MTHDRTDRLSGAICNRQLCRRSSRQDATAVNHRVGVVVSHPIQYFSPLFDLLHQRRGFDVKIMYGNDAGVREQWDPGFDRSHQWDINLVAGHPHRFMTTGESPTRRESAAGYLLLLRWLRGRDIVVIHGWATGLANIAIVGCWAFGIPYLLRTDTSYRPAYSRVNPRHIWPWLVNVRSAGALVVGVKNAQVAQALGNPVLYPAPFAIDIDRFREGAATIGSSRRTRQKAFGLDHVRPVVVYSGKFTPGKRVADLLSAAQRLTDVQFLLIGEGPLAEELHRQAGANVVFAGFLNQTAIPLALACADVCVLPSSYEAWGLAINEAMACGCLPVVSDAVGCGPDLVEGIGEVYSVGDIDALVSALDRVLVASKDSNAVRKVHDRIDEYAISKCAEAYENAFLSRRTGHTIGCLGFRRSGARSHR